ncbi:Retrovirus-related Pol polyprotein from transposon TNT 1-94 [Vitis vinifera]|uniref:Retrovirus-related Pol polyprotein from transposon TNT 1-94 n=1 Tax=Vitis vinifera TaxID=29760 RepID=A0A438C3G8_VITVI|nr:Retrovirus-related Pol polyprotein from transposon TNT 1-94 [Vitis vinifera]
MMMREEMRIIPYSSMVGSLTYAQVCTCLDIAFVVGMLGIAPNLLDVVGFCDADFAGCIDDKKSTTGYIFMMVGGAVSWKSVKQTLTTSSTMEVEYVACYEACCQAMWMRNFISTLGVVDSISRPLKLFCDNSATVAFSKNTRSISHFKHIDILSNGQCKSVVHRAMLDDKAIRIFVVSSHGPPLDTIVIPTSEFVDGESHPPAFHGIKYRYCIELIHSTQLMGKSYLDYVRL